MAESRIIALPIAGSHKKFFNYEFIIIFKISDDFLRLVVASWLGTCCLATFYFSLQIKIKGRKTIMNLNQIHTSLSSYPSLIKETLST